MEPSADLKGASHAAFIPFSRPGLDSGLGFRTPLACARGRGRRLERPRDRGDSRVGADRTRVDDQLGDGARSRLRRRQRDRRRPRGLPAHVAARDAVRLEGCRGRDCRVSRASEPDAGAEAGAGRPLRGVPGDDRRRVAEDARRRRRGGGGRGDDRRARGRRSRSPIHVRDRRPTRRLAAADADRTRPRCVGRGRSAVPDRERLAVPLGRAVPAHEQGLREGLQRGEGARLAHEHDADGRSDEGGDLLAGAADGHLGRPPALALGRAGHRRQGASPRNGRARGRRRGDRLLGRQVLSGTSGGRSQRSERQTRTGTRPPWPTRAGGRCSTRRPRRCRR